MRPDACELRDFYGRPLGGMVRRLLGPRVRARWRDVRGMVVIGIGYPGPFLGAFRGEASVLGALMPQGQGAVRWPEEGASQAALVEDDAIPLPDASVDRLLAVHSVEASESPSRLVREIWRVLKPEGRLMIIVPNRRGPWARSDQTPFGQGRPFSRRQLELLLAPQLFSPIEWSSALFIPPTERRLVLKYATQIERTGSRAWPAFAGLILVEARKEIMAMIGPAAEAVRARRTATARTATSAIRTRQRRPLASAPHDSVADAP